jgi:pimeloyl-ACP methyl ester carboxylesterase
MYSRRVMGEISPAVYRAGSGEPLVLVHGFRATWRVWGPLLGALAARYEVLAPTLAGHDGGPPYTLGSAVTFADQADSLEGQLDELGVSSAHVVGNSLGGALALELAKRGRARTVLALAPGGGWTSGDGEEQRLYRFFKRQFRILRAMQPRAAAIMRRPSIRRLALRDIMRHGELVAPADAVDMVDSALRCTIADDVIESLRDYRDISLRELDRIACPVLLASPQFDRLLPMELHAPRLRREIPGVEARILPGCGHSPMWDDPRLLVQTISEFVDKHTASAAPSESEPVAQATGTS